MNIKKAKIIDLFGIFTLSILFHFIYKWLPNPVFSVLFPVNESIWEHMKLFVSATYIWGIIDYFILKKNNLDRNNFLFQLFIRPLISIAIYLPIYLILKSFFGENMIITIGLMFIVYIISVVISYKLLIHRKINVNSILIIFAMIIIYCIFAYFTYNPVHSQIFYDTKENKYGI